jgi:hypothetical protein
MQFIFTERTVSYPVFEVEADTLAEACRVYAKRTTDGERPDNEETGDNQLMEVTSDTKPVPPETWGPLVERAIDTVNEEDQK